VKEALKSPVFVKAVKAGSISGTIFPAQRKRNGNFNRHGESNPGLLCLTGTLRTSRMKPA
jgi:hypothetical protein